MSRCDRAWSAAVAGGLIGVLAVATARAEVAAKLDGQTQGPVITAKQIEADWLRQEEVRWLPPSPRNRPEQARSRVAPAQDAAGGVDGVKNGTYGFHTDSGDKPWWQVDLGQSVALDRIVIYNRGDGNVEGRAARLQVLLSAEGKTWTRLYEHNGTKFSGFMSHFSFWNSASVRSAEMRLSLAFQLKV